MEKVNEEIGKENIKKDNGQLELKEHEKETVQEKVAQEEIYKELGFWKTFFYASIPFLYGLPLVIVAINDLKNGKEPFHGATNPLVKGFAYLSTATITIPMYIGYKMVMTGKPEFVFNLARKIKEATSSFCSKFSKQKEVEPEIQMEAIEEPKQRVGKLKLADVDKVFNKETSEPEKVKKVDTKGRNINTKNDSLIDKLKSMQKANNLDKQFKVNDMYRQLY